MTGLGLVWLVHDMTGSYGRAGLVTGAFAVTEAVERPRDVEIAPGDADGIAFGLADEILTLWLATAFEGGRHQRRVDQIAELEKPRG